MEVLLSQMRRQLRRANTTAGRMQEQCRKPQRSEKAHAG
ncbi:hypothetical protein EcE22_3952 [Escherichia coli E22]|nr:hypothetical protein EcE22_3952 [Escherichia coli E22]